MVERAINDPVPFYLYKWANWACALAALKTWDGLDTGNFRSVVSMDTRKGRHFMRMRIEHQAGISNFVERKHANSILS